MNILIIGGTLFLGRVVVEQALTGGHTITLCNRGKTRPGLFSDEDAVEQVIADRDDDDQLRAVLGGRSFDAVIDTSAYFGRQVRSIVNVLGDDIRHYTFVSSASVYADHSPIGADESAATITLDASIDESTKSPDAYGGFKAQCEEALAEVLPGRVHNVRAGLIVGPYDNTGRFSYWVERLAAGGAILAPEPKDQPMQIIDVRDLADWMLLAATENITGTYNASGKAGGLTMEAMLEAVAATTGVNPNLEWVAEDFLIAEDVAPWNDLPLWLPPVSRPTHAGFMMRDTSAAVTKGLTFRPLADTVQATADWLGRAEEMPDKDAGPALGSLLTREREEQLLAKWASRTDD